MKASVHMPRDEALIAVYFAKRCSTRSVCFFFPLAIVPDAVLLWIFTKALRSEKARRENKGNAPSTPIERTNAFIGSRPLQLLLLKQR